MLNQTENPGNNMDTEAVIRFMNNQITPQITDLRLLLSGLSKDLTAYINLENERNSQRAMKLVDFESRLSRLETILLGSGKPMDAGIVSDVSHILKWVESRVWLERIIVAAFVAQLAALVVIVLRSSG